MVSLKHFFILHLSLIERVNSMENITIYYKENSEDFLQTIQWFKEHDIIVDLKRIDTITYREIFQLIYLSGLDIPDILKRSKKFSFLCLRSKLNKLRFSEGLSFLELHTELLEIPIVLSDKHAVSGYDEQQIKSFLL